MFPQVIVVFVTLMVIHSKGYPWKLETRFVFGSTICGKQRIHNNVQHIVDHPGQNRVRKRQTGKQTWWALNLAWRVLWKDMRLGIKNTGKKVRYLHFIPGGNLHRKILVPRIPLRQWRFSTVSDREQLGQRRGTGRSYTGYFFRAAGQSSQKPLPQAASWLRHRNEHNSRELWSRIYNY